MTALYRVRGQAGKTQSGEVRRRNAGLRHKLDRPRLRQPGARTLRACSTKTRAEACQVWAAANSTQACGEICSASRQAACKSSLRTPTGAAPITSRGPVTGKAATGSAAGERLEQHQAKGVGLAREHEDVGGRIDLRQFLAMPGAQKHRIRIFPLQRRAGRAIADDELGAGQIEIEERLEILFDRDAADAEEHRLRQAEVGGARMKQRGVDAARPQHHIAKAALAQFSWQAPASPPSPPGSAGGTSAARARPIFPGSASAPRRIPESACGSSW